jgi:hypothetical protein
MGFSCGIKPIACFISMMPESTMVAVKPATMPLPMFVELKLPMIFAPGLHESGYAWEKAR